MGSVTEDRAMQLLAESIRAVVGERSEAYRDMLRAFESQQMVDLMLAQSSFDALPLDVRQKIAGLVKQRVAAIEKDE